MRVLLLFIMISSACCFSAEEGVPATGANGSPKEEKPDTFNHDKNKFKEKAKRMKEERSRVERNRDKKKKKLVQFAAEDLEMLHEIMDTDKNGVLSKEELSAFNKAQETLIVKKEELAFKRIDVNGDGVISIEEQVNAKLSEIHEKGKKTLLMLKEKRPEEFAKHDTDGNGEVNDEECAAFTKIREQMESDRMKKRDKTTFMKMDADKDGLVTYRELHTYVATLLKKQKDAAKQRKEQAGKKEMPKPQTKESM